MIDEKNREIATELIREAMTELDEHYSKIRKSQKILQYKNNGELLAEIYICILASFSMMQILEFTAKSKMVNNDTQEQLPRKERFLIGLGAFQQKFELFVNQQLRNME